MRLWISKYWFFCSLILLATITLADRHEWTIGTGIWLKEHGGPNWTIFFIFVLSGISIDASQLKIGLRDIWATSATLWVIFVISPLLALGYRIFHLDIQIMAGLYMVAAMPTTLSTGVVMTESAGGNMAHALFVTIVANCLAVVTIPFVLSLLLAAIGSSTPIVFDKAAIMLKIAYLVLLPLAIGMTIQSWVRKRLPRLQAMAGLINSLLVLMIVWMGLCQSREAIISGGDALLPIVAVTFSYHLMLVILALGTAKFLKIGPGRRESIIFMGGQKTLPLSVILIVTLFPGFGLALAVCVVHHIIHLLMDSYLIVILKKA